MESTVLKSFGVFEGSLRKDDVRRNDKGVQSRRSGCKQDFKGIKEAWYGGHKAAPGKPMSPFLIVFLS